MIIAWHGGAVHVHLWWLLVAGLLWGFTSALGSGIGEVLGREWAGRRRRRRERRDPLGPW